MIWNNFFWVFKNGMRAGLTSLLIDTFAVFVPCLLPYIKRILHLMPVVGTLQFIFFLFWQIMVPWLHNRKLTLRVKGGKKLIPVTGSQMFSGSWYIISLFNSCFQSTVIAVWFVIWFVIIFTIAKHFICHSVQIHQRAWPGERFACLLKTNPS